MGCNWSFERDGYVPDEKTAIKIAEAVWIAIYGDRVLKKKPYTATLEEGVWFVEGHIPFYYLGGVPYAEIRKQDGKILEIYHTK